jgi:hypothetical protein
MMKFQKKVVALFKNKKTTFSLLSPAAELYYISTSTGTASL